MSDYNLLIALEKDEHDGVTTTWWSVDHFHDLEEAQAAVDALLEHIEHATGFKPEQLDNYA